jgi:hypothetical protein
MNEQLQYFKFENNGGSKVIIYETSIEDENYYVLKNLLRFMGAIYVKNFKKILYRQKSRN